MSKSVFNEGMQVEVFNSDPGSGVCWFEATIRSISKKNNEALIEYNTKQLRESVNVVNLRPMAPRETNPSFKERDEIDAYDNGAWWGGTVSKVLEGETVRYLVYFSPSKKQIEFGPEMLRRHYEWVDGSWVLPLEPNTEAETQLPENTPVE